MSFVALAGIAFAFTPLAQRGDGPMLDLAFQIERRIAPRAATLDITLIGIDEASLTQIGLPFALWHQSLAEALRGIAAAAPRAVGLDIALPDRSYADLLPGTDEMLATALATTRARAPVVLAFTLDASTGEPRRILPLFLAAAGMTANGYALWQADADGTVRRFDERVGANGEAVPTFAGQLTRALGIEPQPGYIDYAIGIRYSYVPFAQVLAWSRANDVPALERAFAGKVVLVGSVLALEDRHRQPANLAAWETAREAPGLLATAQTLRAQTAHSMITPAGGPLTMLLVVLAAMPALARRARAALHVGIALAVGFVLGQAGALAMHFWLPLPALFATLLLAMASVAIARAFAAHAERDYLKRTFGGFVSPPVMAALLDGSLRADRPARAELAFFFADIRDFSDLSLTLQPERLYGALNRYYERLVATIHAHGGTIDNFRGDGLMAFFGAPQTLPNPSRNAVLAAQGAQKAIAVLNEEFAREDLPPMRVAIGLAWGDAVVGPVGAAERNNYTALGHAANLAAHLQTLSKSEDGVVFATDELVRHANEGSWREIGPRLMKGRVTATIFALCEASAPRAAAAQAQVAIGGAS